MNVLFSIEHILEATHGQLLVSGRTVFSGVAINSREVQTNDLFIALRGERTNGHQFLADAKARGAAGALIDEAVPGIRRRHTTPGDWSIIEVTDNLYALGQLAQYHRRRFKVPVIGITGSAGKTTTKEMTAAILAQEQNVLKSPGNNNNEIGMPLTLLRFQAKHQSAVLEFGMRGRGQIGYLAALAKPTIGVITNIGNTHLELLTSQDEIALAKAELLDEMGHNSRAILPLHDAYYSLLREHAPGEVLTIGVSDDADVWASDIHLGEQGCMRFNLHSLVGSFLVQLATPGRHQVLNALGAATAAMVAGATPSQIQSGLAAYRPEKGRMRIETAPRGFTVVDDTYNANPAAVRATLDFLAEVPAGRKVAILGDMRELGSVEIAMHREIGHYAMELGIDALLTVGELGREYINGANDSRALWFPDNASAAHAALTQLSQGDMVLVKGSRAMKMEEIVTTLLMPEEV